MTKHIPTIKEIAQTLKVSVSTVSRALSNDVRIGLRTRMRVQDLAKQINYVPNQIAKHLRQHKSFTIGVLLPQLKEEFFSLAIAGIEDALEGTNYHVFIAQSRDTLEREISVLKSFYDSRVDGVIASISAETSDFKHFSDLADIGIPTVFFDRVPSNFPAHMVVCNVQEGAEAVVQFLLDKGVRNIALLNGPASLEISQERQKGFRIAMKKAGIDLNPDYEKFTDLSRADIAEKLLELLSEPEVPEAIFAFNDYVALDAMSLCRQFGKQPNRDILFASFANLPFTRFLENPPVASVDQFAYEMGKQAALMLLEILQEPDHDKLAFREKVLETKLVVHQSSILHV
jgi:DNA-binding LacI/PurR family transcriptional regulator